VQLRVSRAEAVTLCETTVATCLVGCQPVQRPKERSKAEGKRTQPSHNFPVDTHPTQAYLSRIPGANILPTRAITLPASQNRYTSRQGADVLHTHFRPMEPDAIGTVLEETKRDWALSRGGIAYNDEMILWNALPALAKSNNDMHLTADTKVVIHNQDVGRSATLGIMFMMSD
jgi:hypothetical protein